MVEKELLDNLGKAVNDFRVQAEASAQAVKAFGSQLGEHTEKMEKMHARLDSLETTIGKANFADELAAQQKKTAEALEEFEAKLNRINFGKDGKMTPALTGHQKAFTKAVRGGLLAKDLMNHRADFTADEVKALIVGNDVAGGYLAPLEFVNQLMEVNLVEISPIRPLCGRRTTSRQGIEMPTLESHTAAAWVGETQTRSEQRNPAFGKREIRVNEQLAKVLVSQQDLEDSIFDVEGMLRQEFATQMGVAENIAFLTGDGANKPFGILANTSLENVNSAAANELDADAILNVQTALKSYYMSNARYVFSRLTLRTIRTMKDGNGQYLWQPSYQAGVPTMLAGFPYTVAVDMPSIASGEKPVLFGDFRQGYMIVDRLELQVQTDPYSSMESGMVRFVGRRRVGGQVVVPEALCTITIA